jgi:Domain of unknown function (DUF1707)
VTFGRVHAPVRESVHARIPGPAHVPVPTTFLSMIGPRASLSEMARHGSLRASDADREQVVDRLRSAAGEGRLAAPELEHRVGTALAARTYGELDATIADLPGPRRQRRTAVSALRAHPVLLLAAIPVVLVAVALLAAITVASLAIAAVLFIIGRRRTMYLGPGAFLLRHGAGARGPTDRRSPGQWGRWA